MRSILSPASRSCGSQRARSPKAVPSGTSFAAAVRTGHVAAGSRRAPCRTPAARRRVWSSRSASRSAAERLYTRIATVRRGLHVAGRLPRHFERRTGHRDRHAERRPRAVLTIGAMTDRGLFRIRFRFDRDVAAVAGAVDFHGFSSPLLPRPPDREDAIVIDSCTGL